MYLLDSTARNGGAGAGGDQQQVRHLHGDFTSEESDEDEEESALLDGQQHSSVSNLNLSGLSHRASEEDIELMARAPLRSI